MTDTRGVDSIANGSPSYGSTITTNDELMIIGNQTNRAIIRNKNRVLTSVHKGPVLVSNIF